MTIFRFTKRLSELIGFRRFFLSSRRALQPGRRVFIFIGETVAAKQHTPLHTGIAFAPRDFAAMAFLIMGTAPTAHF